MEKINNKKRGFLKKAVAAVMVVGAVFMMPRALADARLFRDSGTNSFLIDKNGNRSYVDLRVDGTLDTQGARKKNTRRATTTDTILVTDEIIFENTDAGTYTATLPAGVQEQTFKIINSGSSGNALTLAPNGTDDLIGVNSNFTLNDGETLDITFDSTDGWY